MKLQKVFLKLRPSIVAFGSLLARGKDGKPPSVPPIVGTGFFVHPGGVVATNRHVAEFLLSLPCHPKLKKWAAFAFVFTSIRKQRQGLGMGAHMVDIHSIHPLTTFSTPDDYYGEPIPDLAFAQLRVREVPAVKLATKNWSIRVGMDIATAGFPLGEDPLVIEGAIAQGTPLLRRGIVSAVNPFPCPQPHGFVIDIMSQGGASGSPIFRTDKPEVNGILYAGFDGSNITYAVPSLLIRDALSVYLKKCYEELKDTPSINEIPMSEETKTSFAADEWDAV